MRIQNFSQALTFLFETVPKTSAEMHRGNRGLEKSQRFMAALDNIQDRRPAIHIAATSGKGTVAYLLEALLEAQGQTTAMLTSPHVYTLRERVHVNGAMISEEEFTALLNQLLPVYQAFAKRDDAPSYFEMNLALGFLAANQHNVAYSIVETGLGGLLDTTNTIDRADKLCIIGQIGYDHTDILGNTLAEIAAQKAGIIQSGQTVIALRQETSVNTVIEQRAREKSAHLVWVTAQQARSRIPDLGALNDRLPGDHQYCNLALALAAIEELAGRDNWSVSEAAVREAVGRVAIPGRFDVQTYSDKTIIFDGAHNQQKLAAVLQALQERFTDSRLGVVFATGHHHEVSDLLKQIRRQADMVILTEYHSLALDMFRPAYDFSRTVKAPHTQYASRPEEVAQQILESTLPVWLVTGSFYVLSDVREALSGHS